METIKTLLFVVPAKVTEDALTTRMNSNSWYFAGAVIAFLILVYLIATLAKPEKF